MIRRDELALLVIDFQEKLLETVPRAEEAVAMTVKLIRVARELEVPILVSEQYPKGLGSTTGAISSEIDGFGPFKKLSFACLGDADFKTALKATGKKDLLIAGIETHVCVMQTVLMAIELGYETFVVCDAVASHDDFNHEAALHRMEKAGAELVTGEMAVFETLQEAGTEDFENVIPLLKKD